MVKVRRVKNMVKNVFSGHHFSPIFARAPCPSGLASVLSFPHPSLGSLFLFYPRASTALPRRRLGSKEFSYPCSGPFRKPGSTPTHLPSLLSTHRSWSQEYRSLISSPNSSARWNALARGTSVPSPHVLAHLKAPPATKSLSALLSLFSLCQTLSCTFMVLVHSFFASFRIHQPLYYPLFTFLLYSPSFLIQLVPGNAVN